MKSNHPAFTENHLNEIVDAFTTRSKALKHKVGIISYNKEIDEGYERLNIDCERPYDIRLSIWSDNEAFVRTCQSSKNGWLHNISLSGNLGNLEPHIIEERFEKGLNICNQKELLALWPELSAV